MSDFQQAIKWMKEGKKVIQKSNNLCVFAIENSDFDREIILSDVEATDWEIFKEEKPPVGIGNIGDLNKVNCEKHGMTSNLHYELYGKAIGIFCFVCTNEFMSKNIKNYVEDLK